MNCTCHDPTVFGHHCHPIRLEKTTHNLYRLHGKIMTITEATQIINQTCQNLPELPTTIRTTQKPPQTREN